jgi:hypothetical protein
LITDRMASSRYSPTLKQGIIIAREASGLMLPRFILFRLSVAKKLLDLVPSVSMGFQGINSPRCGAVMGLDNGGHVWKELILV